MLRIALALLIVSALGIGSAITFAAGQAVDTPLGQCAAGSDTLQLTLREDTDGKSVLALSAGNAMSRQSFNLQTPCFAHLDKTFPSALKIAALDPSTADNLIAAFTTHSVDGDQQSICVWLAKTGGRWSLRGEWPVDTFNHRELGEKNESQTFAFDAAGNLNRSASRNNIQGIKTTCAQGCCVAWQTKTMVTEEQETLAWNTALNRAERKAFHRWYITQYGDGLLSIAQKIWGNPERMATLLRLNPELQKLDTLPENQKVLIEKFGM